MIAPPSPSPAQIILASWMREENSRQIDSNVRLKNVSWWIFKCYVLSTLGTRHRYVAFVQSWSKVCFKWKRTWIWTNFTRCWLQVISMIRKSDYLRDKNPVCIPIGQTVSMVAEWYLKIQLKKRGLKMREQLICCIPSLDMLDKNGVPGCGGDTSR